MGFTDATARHAKPRDKDYKITVEKSLFLLVRKTGQRLWRFKYHFAGKEKSLSIGVYPAVSLKEARAKRDEAKRMLDEGKDPSLEKQIQKQLKIHNYQNNFEAIAREWFEVKLSDRSVSHRAQSIYLLEKHLFPYLGIQPIDRITAPQLLAIIRRIENRGNIDTGGRVKQVAGQVFKYAIQTGRADRNPAADLNGALRPHKQTHFAAITTPDKAGFLMRSIDNYGGTETVKAALKLSALFFLRPGELRVLEWNYVNWRDNRIECPDYIMKPGRPHIVPLSLQAKKILEKLNILTGNGKYIFPSWRGNDRPMSKDTIRVALRVMGIDANTMTPHGFRAMARTLLDEVLGFRLEWIEQQLSHEVRDSTGRAYNRTQYLPQRAEMMQRWADYLDELNHGESYHQSGENVVFVKFR